MLCFFFFVISDVNLILRVDNSVSVAGLSSSPPKDLEENKENMVSGSSKRQFYSHL